ncbi:MAG: hypothetical protein R3Y32_02400 [Bacillota bacterium]
MANINNHFRGYMAWKKEITQVATKKLSEEEAKTPVEEDNNIVERFIVDVSVDTSWLEVFEEFFPFIDNCIQEYRSVLMRINEITPIERAKKIDVKETLLHLVKNTNDIMSYNEETGEIVPSKLVTVLYESTSMMYENIMIFSLVCRCNEFVYSCYHDIERAMNKQRYKVKYEEPKKSLEINSECEMEMFVQYDSYAAAKAKMDSGAIPNVDRVTVLKNKVGEFMNSQLCRDLRDVAQIRGTLTMTNILLKNVNFSKCVEFWDYLNKYAEEKVKIQERPQIEYMTVQNRSDMVEMHEYLQFLIRLYYDNFFKMRLEDRYEKYLIEEENVARQKRERAKRDENNRIQKAVVAQQIADYRLFNRVLLGSDADKLEREVINPMFELLDKYAQMDDSDYDERQKLYADLLSDIRTKIRNLAREIPGVIGEGPIVKESFKNPEVGEIFQMIKDANDAYCAQKSLENTKQLEEIMTSARQEFEKLKEEMSAKLESIHEEYGEKIQDLRSENQSRVAKQNGQHKAELERLKHNQGVEMNRVVRECNEQIAVARKEFVEKAEKVKAYYDDALTKAKSEYKTKLANVEAQRKKEHGIILLKHKKLMEGLKANNQREVSALRFTLSKNAKEYKLKLKRQHDAQNKRFDNANKEYIAVIARLKKEQKSLIDKLTKDNASAIRMLEEKTEKEVRDLKASHKKYTDNLERETKASIENVFKTTNQQMARLQKESDTRYENVNRELRATVFNLNKEHKTIIRDMQKRMDKHSESQKKSYEDDIHRLNIEKNEAALKAEKLLEKTIEKYKKENADSNSKLTLDYQSQIDKIHAQNTNDIRFLNVENKKEINSINSDNEKKLANKDSEHKKQIEALQKEIKLHDKESLANLQREISALQAENKKQLETFQGESQYQIFSASMQGEILKMIIANPGCSEDKILATIKNNRLCKDTLSKLKHENVIYSTVEMFVTKYHIKTK